LETIMAKKARGKAASKARARKAKAKVRGKARKTSKARTASTARTKRKATAKRTARKKAPPKAETGIIATVTHAFETVRDTIKETAGLRNKMEQPGTSETQ